MKRVNRNAVALAVFYLVFAPPARAQLADNLEQLTFGTIQEAEPKFSFDGTEIVYRNLHSPYSWDNCDIWTMSSDGSAQTRVTTDWRGEFSPSFAPDGRVTYTKEFGTSNYDLWVSNPDGTGAHQLVGGPGRQSLAEWDPGGSRLTYQSTYTSNAGELWAVDADGTSNKTKLTDHTVDGYHQDYPVYSTSGNLIAYGNVATSTSGFDIWVMNNDGSQNRQITSSAGSEAPMFWWPDDSAIGYAKDGALYRYDLDLGTDELLLSVPGKTINWADLSPDATKLVFDLSDGTIGGGHIWTADVEAAEPKPEPGTYGVFVGRNDLAHNLLGWDIPLRTDLQAQTLCETVKESLGLPDTSAVANPKDPLGDTPNITMKSDISSAIRQFKTKSGDKLLLYLAGHRGSEDCGTETTLTPGNEYVNVGEVIDDDWLTNMLEAQVPNVEKWVFIDSCHSGGFWAGDLDRLSNIAFFASAAEDRPSWADWGNSLFGLALDAGFSRDPAGYLLADCDYDGEISFEDMSRWLMLWPSRQNLAGTPVYEMGFGDPATFTSDMWSPVAFKSDDFTGSLSSSEVVPAPGAMILCTIGLSYATWLLHRKTQKEGTRNAKVSACNNM